VLALRAPTGFENGSYNLHKPTPAQQEMKTENGSHRTQSAWQGHWRR